MNKKTKTLIKRYKTTKPNSLEKGEIFFLLSKELTRKEIERETGCAQSYISQLISLHLAPDKVKKLIAAGTMSVAKALTMGSFEHIGSSETKITKMSPIRKMKILYAALRQRGVKNEKTETLKYLISQLQSSEPEQMTGFFIPPKRSLEEVLYGKS